MARARSYKLSERFEAMAKWFNDSGVLSKYAEANDLESIELDPLTLQIAIREAGEFAKSEEAKAFKTEAAEENLAEKEEKIRKRLENARKREEAAAKSREKNAKALEALRSKRTVGGTDSGAASAQSATEDVAEAPEGSTDVGPTEDEPY